MKYWLEVEICWCRLSRNGGTWGQGRFVHQIKTKMFEIMGHTERREKIKTCWIQDGWSPQKKRFAVWKVSKGLKNVRGTHRLHSKEIRTKEGSFRRDDMIVSRCRKFNSRNGCGCVHAQKHHVKKLSRRGRVQLHNHVPLRQRARWVWKSSPQPFDVLFDSSNKETDIWSDSHLRKSVYSQ